MPWALILPAGEPMPCKATSTFRPAAHDAAKEKALANLLAMICAAPGFPPMPKNTGGVVCDVPNLSSTYPVCGPKRKAFGPV